MQNIYISFSAVFPLMCLLSLGYFLALLKMYEEKFYKQINALCFKVFLPILIFINIYKANFDLSRSIFLILFSLVSVFIFFALLAFVIPRIISEKKDSGVLIQAGFRSNIVLFGLPVASTLYGAEGLQTISILVAFVIPLYNVLSVFILQIYSEKKVSISNVLIGVAKNPLIIASLLGFVFTGFAIDLPILVENTLSSIGAIVTPLSLIALGATFKIKEISKFRKSLYIGIVAKLICMPLFVLPLGVYFGLRPVEIVALMAVLVSPTAVASYTMAQNMGANDELAGQLVVFTSILSIFSIFAWISVLQILGIL